MVQHAQTPYIGSKISLISNSDIRYEGILYTVNTRDATIALAKVRSFGTEDRPTETPVASHHEIFEYIIFKASDIKDLMVCETPQAVPELCGGLSDPAIVSMSQMFQARSRGALGAPVSAQSQRDAEHAAHAARALSPQLTSVTSVDRSTSVSGDPHHFSPPHPNSRSLSRQQADNVASHEFTSGVIKQEQMSQVGTPGGFNNGSGPFHQNRQYHRGGYNNLGGYRGFPQGFVPYRNFNNGNMRVGGHPGMGMAHGQMAPQMGPVNGGFPFNPYMQMPHNNRRGNLMQRGSGPRGSPRFYGRGGPGPKDRPLPRDDYDFEKANLKFAETLSTLKDEFEHKTKICDEADEASESTHTDKAASIQPAVQDVSPLSPASSQKSGTGSSDETPTAYDKHKSFFDNISSEATERVSRELVQQPFGGDRRDRQVNVDTFGSNAVRYYQMRRQARGAYRQAAFGRGAAGAMPFHQYQQYRQQPFSPYNPMRSGGFHMGAGGDGQYPNGPRAFQPFNQSGYRRGYGGRPFNQQAVY